MDFHRSLDRQQRSRVAARRSVYMQTYHPVAGEMLEREFDTELHQRYLQLI
jgi:hypothetical protein